MSVLLRFPDGSATVAADGSVTLNVVDPGALPAVTTAATGDLLAIRQISSGNDKAITLANAIASQTQTIHALPPNGSPSTALEIAVCDSSGNTTKITLAQLLGLGGGTSAPVNTAAPTITGTAQVGQTLTASQGTWSNSPTSYAYVWKRAGTAISGATSSTYVPVSGDVGSALTVTVTATNAGGSASATSAATSAVTASGSAATAYTFTTANPATSGAAQTITFAANGTLSGNVTITPATSGTGTFNPATVTLTSGATSGTTQWTPGAAGTVSLTATNNGGLTNPTATNVTVNAASQYPTLVFSTGPTWDTAAPKFGSGDAVSAMIAQATGINLGTSSPNFTIELWLRGESGGSNPDAYATNGGTSFIGLSDGTNSIGARLGYNRLFCAANPNQSDNGNVPGFYDSTYHYQNISYGGQGAGIIAVAADGGNYASYTNATFTGGTNCTFLLNLPTGIHVDAIKISKGIVNPTTVPTAAPTRDANTVVIWQLDGNGTGS